DRPPPSGNIHRDATGERRVVQFQARDPAGLRDVEDQHTGHRVPRVDVFQERLRVLVGVQLGGAVVLVRHATGAGGLLVAAVECARRVADVAYHDGDQAELALSGFVENLVADRCLTALDLLHSELELAVPSGLADLGVPACRLVRSGAAVGAAVRAGRLTL